MTPTISRRSVVGTMTAAAASLLLAAGCSAPAPVETAASDRSLIADLGFEGMGAKDIITELDALPVAERSTQLMASIRPGELVLVDAAKREAAVSMPADEFYVSVAPYVDQTHECHFHSLTTCLGELANKDMDITVTNDQTGEVLVKEGLSTYDNGFMGLWLPRGIDATLTVDYDGKSGTQPLSTKTTDDATCVTTLQLS